METEKRPPLTIGHLPRELLSMWRKSHPRYKENGFQWYYRHGINLLITSKKREKVTRKKSSRLSKKLIKKASDYTDLALPHWKNHVLLTGSKTLIMPETASLDSSAVTKVSEMDAFSLCWELSNLFSILRPRRQMVDSGSANTSMPTKAELWLTSVLLSSNMT